MLADFAIRLACGLAVMLLADPLADRPAGLLPDALPDHPRPAGPGRPRPARRAAGAVPRRRSSRGRRSSPTSARSPGAWACHGSAVPIDGGLIVLATGGLVGGVARAVDWELWALNAAGRLASAFLMGATLTAMLLGHYYLTAPAMSIEPLRAVRPVHGLGAAACGRLLAGAGAGGSGIGGAGPSVAPVVGLAVLPRDALGDGVRRAGPGDRTWPGRRSRSARRSRRPASSTSP